MEWNEIENEMQCQLLENCESLLQIACSKITKHSTEGNTKQNDYAIY